MAQTGRCELADAWGSTDMQRHRQRRGHEGAFILRRLYGKLAQGRAAIAGRFALPQNAPIAL